jgi:hypothetical protein
MQTNAEHTGGMQTDAGENAGESIHGLFPSTVIDACGNPNDRLLPDADREH